MKTNVSVSIPLEEISDFNLGTNFNNNFYYKSEN